MAVLLTDGDEGLFDRLGRIFKIAKNIEGWQTGASTSLDTELADILARYSDDLDLASGIVGALESMQVALAGPYAILARTAERTLVEMVHDDNPLSDASLNAALDELIIQMIGSGTFAEFTINPDDDIDGGSRSLSSSADSNNTGDGDVAASALSDSGVILQHSRAEDIVLTCTTDAQEGAVTAGREIFSIVGEAPVQDIRRADWPGGSGISASLQVSDPAQNAQKSPGKNILHNSAMETFTVQDTLDNWTANTGTFGTDFLEEGTIVFRGNKSLALVGDGSTLINMSQAFGTSGATTGKLRPKKLYRLNFQFYGNTSATTGTLQISVKDGSNNILNGGIAKKSIVLSTSSAAWSSQYVIFATPTAIPVGTKCVIELTAALDNTEKVYIDDLCLIEMPRFGGPSGPTIALFPGATDWVRDDKITLTQANPAESEFAHYFDKFFDMYGRGKILPYDTGGSETIADTLIT